MASMGLATTTVANVNVSGYGQGYNAIKRNAPTIAMGMAHAQARESADARWDGNKKTVPSTNATSHAFTESVIAVPGCVNATQGTSPRTAAKSFAQETM